MNTTRYRLLIVCALVGVTAVPALSNADDQPRPARVLNFPRDRKVGMLGIYELEPGQEFRFSLDGWNMWKGPSAHVDARGEVTVPENRIVALYPDARHLRNLSWLARLGPNDIDVVRFEPTIPQLNLPVAGNEVMAHIARLTGLRELHVYFTDITDKGLEPLAELQNLEKLTLPGDITDVGFAEVARLPRLKVLAGLGYGVTSKSADLLAGITTLEELRLRQHQMTDEDLACLAKLPRLRALSLGGSELTDAALLHLQNIPTLKSLNVSDMDITDAGAAHLAKMTQLEELNVHNTLLTDCGMAHLAALPSLKKLMLDGFGSNRIEITDEGMASIGKMASLEHLRLPGYPPRRDNITDAGFAHLADLKRLKYLWACTSSISPLSDVTLEHLAHVSSLEALTISSTRFTDQGLAHLARLTNLRELSLSTAVGPITDTGLAHLAQLRQLRRLKLGRGGELTVPGLSQLNALSELASLNVGTHLVRGDGTALDLSGLSKLERLTILGDLRDRDLATLANLRSLEYVVLRGPFTREGALHLTGLPNLTSFNMIGPGISDDVLDCLAACEGLLSLVIHGSFTDRGLLALARCKSLRGLRIESDRPFSRRAVARLQNRNPPIFVRTNSVQASPSRSTGRRR